jgi:hypothetical protein
MTLASGCARVGVTTQVQESGAWSRTRRFSGDSGDAIRSTLILPQGQEWRVATTRDAKSTTVIAHRALPAGETLRGDVAVRSGDESAGRPALTTEVTVRADGPDRWEYREVLRWQGPRLRAAAPEMALALGLRAALPRDRVSDAECRAVARHGARACWRFLMGPPEPLLFQAPLHRDWGERRLNAELAVALAQGLRERLGERLTAPERSSAVATVQPSIRHLQDTLDDPAERALSIPLTFAARLPGRVTETNGAIDPMTGEVSWGLHAGAAGVGEVILTATSVAETPALER